MTQNFGLARNIFPSRHAVSGLARPHLIGLAEAAKVELVLGFEDLEAVGVGFGALATALGFPGAAVPDPDFDFVSIPALSKRSRLHCRPTSITSPTFFALFAPSYSR